MRLLLDTHLLLWAGSFPDRLSEEAIQLMEDPRNQLIFSVASLWEIAIKFSRGRRDFETDPSLLRTDMLRSDYRELPIDARHAIAAGALPAVHKDPFDRMLVAQAMVEGMVLLTADTRIGEYHGPVRLI